MRKTSLNWVENGFKRTKDGYVFSYTTLVKGEVEQVWDFFSRPKNIELVNPPSSHVFVDLSIEDQIVEGFLFAIKMKVLKFFTQKIKTKVVKVTAPNYFQDIQEKGAFKSWKHEHFFTQEKENTVVKDVITFQVPFGIIGRLFFKFYLKKELSTTFKYRVERLNVLFE